MSVPGLEGPGFWAGNKTTRTLCLIIPKVELRAGLVALQVTSPRILIIRLLIDELATTPDILTIAIQFFFWNCILSYLFFPFVMLYLYLLPRDILAPEALDGCRFGRWQVARRWMLCRQFLLTLAQTPQRDFVGQFDPLSPGKISIFGGVSLLLFDSAVMNIFLMLWMWNFRMIKSNDGWMRANNIFLRSSNLYS